MNYNSTILGILVYGDMIEGVRVLWSRTWTSCHGWVSSGHYFIILFITNFSYTDTTFLI